MSTSGLAAAMAVADDAAVTADEVSAFGNSSTAFSLAARFLSRLALRAGVAAVRCAFFRN